MCTNSYVELECAKRWQHFLNPELDHSEWTVHDDQCLLAKVEQHGNNWRKIVDEALPGRSATDVKNRYGTLGSPSTIPFT